MGAQLPLPPGPGPQTAHRGEGFPCSRPPVWPRYTTALRTDTAAWGPASPSPSSPTAPGRAQEKAQLPPQGPARLASALTARPPATGPLHMLFPRLVKSQGEGLVHLLVPSPPGLARPQGAQAARCRTLMTSLAALTCSSGLVSARLWPPNPHLCTAAPLASVWS